MLETKFLNYICSLSKSGWKFDDQSISARTLTTYEQQQQHKYVVFQPHRVEKTSELMGYLYESIFVLYVDRLI